MELPPTPPASRALQCPVTAVARESAEAPDRESVGGGTRW